MYIFYITVDRKGKPLMNSQIPRFMMKFCNLILVSRLNSLIWHDNDCNYASYRKLCCFSISYVKTMLNAQLFNNTSRVLRTHPHA